MNFNNFNNQHSPNSALEASRMFDEQKAKQKQMLEEKQNRERIEEKRHHETTSLTAKNINLMEENNQICRKSLRNSVIANWIAGFAAFIAVCSFILSICSLLKK